MMPAWPGRAGVTVTAAGTGPGAGPWSRWARAVLPGLSTQAPGPARDLRVGATS
jgi:hypothetical protein